jgi:hypothetical protein
MNTSARTCLLLCLPFLGLTALACTDSHVAGGDGSVSLSDGSVPYDSGGLLDHGAGPDLSAFDIGASDVGPRDLGNADSGSADSGSVDAGTPDLGQDAGVVCEDSPAAPQPGARPIIIPPTDDCRTSSDCDGGAQCFGASDGFCGICQVPLRECEDDGDCGSSAWCRASQRSCCGGVDTACVPRCTPGDGACQEGEICDGATGRCERNGCLALDLACQQNHDCDPTRPDADALGCARRACSADSECDCGFCVTGTCESQLGVCSFPSP